MNYPAAKDFVFKRLKEELKTSLYYHNFQHTLDVCESTERIAELENVNGEDLVLLKTAAVYHDTGFLIQYDNNEEIACDIARETLPQFGYSPEHIYQIEQMILATKVPQTPQNHLAEILCDADLDYIGRDDFFITALRLHREWSENSTKKITFKDWYMKQLLFVQKHDFFTLTARKLREEKKKHNLSQIKELLSLLETTIGEKF